VIVDGGHIGALQVDDPAVETEPSDQLPEADIDCIDALCASIEQRGREATSGGPDVHGYDSLHVKTEGIQRGRHLQVSAQSAWPEYPDARVCADSGSRIGDGSAVDNDSAI
jgi:hypothetical protein